MSSFFILSGHLNQIRNCHIGTDLDSRASMSDMGTLCWQSTPFTVHINRSEKKDKIVKNHHEQYFVVKLTEHIRRV